MELYNLKNRKLAPVKKVPFKLERDIQNLVEDNLQVIFDLEFVKSEFSIKNFRLDTLCFDKENKSFVIIEYKKSKNYSVIDQGYTYMSIMLNNKSDFILEYNENKNVALKRTDINWEQSRVIFVSPTFTDYQRNSVEFKDVPFELWEISQFSNNTIIFNRHRSISKESVTAVAKNDDVITNVNKEIKVYHKDDHLTKGSHMVKELYDAYEKRMLELDEIEVVATKMYIGFKLGKRIISDIQIQKNSVKLGINMKWGQLTDPRGLFRDVSEIGHHGVGDYQCKLTDESELDYVMTLIRECYKFHSNN